MPVPDIKKCLHVMKTLEKENEKLTDEKNILKKEAESLKEHVNSLQKKLNELSVVKDATVCASPTESTMSSQIATIDQLTAQNLSLRNELQHDKEYDKVHDVVNKSDLEIKILELKSIISQNEKELAYLKQNNSNFQFAKKLADLRQLLSKSKAVNQSYAKEISSLQKQLDALIVSNPKETQAQAASGDQDMTFPVTNCTMYAEPVKDEFFKENTINWQTKLQEQDCMISKLKIERDELVAKTTELEEENDRLKTQFKILTSANDFPIDTQMKFFLDDFYDERKEKEKQVQENSRLKQELDRLLKFLHPTTNSNTPVQKQPTFDQYQQQRSMYEQPRYERNLSSQDEKYFHSTSYNSSAQAKQNSTRFENNYSGANFKPSFHQQHSNSLQSNYGENENFPARRIGFSSRFSPTSPPFQPQMPFTQSNPCLTMTEQASSSHQVLRQPHLIRYEQYLVDASHSVRQQPKNVEELPSEKPSK